MRKYGVDNFTCEQIEQLDTLDACNQAEENWIQYLQTRDRRFGYNIAFGGANRATSQETKDKLSILNSGEGNPFYGRKHTEETKQKLAELKLNTTHSEETKQKMSEAHKGEKNVMFGKKHSSEALAKMVAAKIGKYDGENNPFYGKTHSNETKQIISEKNKGKIISDETKEKMSKSLMGKMVGEKNPMFGKRGKETPMFGKHHTEEAKQKISEFRKGKKLSAETRKKMSDSKKGKPSNRRKNKLEQVTAIADIDKPCGIEGASASAST